MNKFLSLFVILCIGLNPDSNLLEDKHGQITFFSYTSVENIEAVNNQAWSYIDTENGEIVVSILMRAFVFKKTLMREHFNESYIESDLYPNATFEGKIIDFDPSIDGTQTRIIKGNFTLRNITKPIEFKANIVKTNGIYSIDGNLEVGIDDYNIKVPALLSPNVAKTIKVSFNFNYSSQI